jgi:hypothetical protein
MRSPTKLFVLWILTQAISLVDAETIMTGALRDLINGISAAERTGTVILANGRERSPSLKRIKDILHDEVWKSEISAMRRDLHSWMIEIEFQISRFYQEELEIGDRQKLSKSGNSARSTTSMAIIRRFSFS